jgi:hypothetical protein
MAQLLRQAIDSGAPPSLARIPMTPEEVAASYDEVEDGYDGGDCGGESAGALKNEARDTRCRAPSWVIQAWRQDSPRQWRRGEATDAEASAARPQVQWPAGAWAPGRRLGQDRSVDIPAVVAAYDPKCRSGLSDCVTASTLHWPASHT